MGLWLCHTCTMKEKIASEKEEMEKANFLEPTPSTDSTSSSGIGSCQISQDIITPEGLELKELSVKIESESMLVDEEIQKNEESVEPEAEVEKEKENGVESPTEKDTEENLSPFEELIRVASLLNPKQFELPVEMTQPFPFPGTERVEPIRNGRRVKNKRLIELDSYGCVPLPAKLCFACNKSCKRAPLISCDYCTLYFHQDCLDPPMTALPAGRWMCPNHPQHFIVRNFLKNRTKNLFLFIFKFRIGILCHQYQPLNA